MPKTLAAVPRAVLLGVQLPDVTDVDHEGDLAELGRLVHTLGAVGTTSQAYLRVPIGVAIGVLFLGESLPPPAWAGLVCVVAGVAAMAIPPRRRPEV